MEGDIISKQKTFIILLIVVIFIFVIGIVLSLSPDFDSKEDWLATDVEPLYPHYLTSQGGEESKIFLVNASAKYSFWRENDTIIGYGYNPSQTHEFPLVKTGDPMFIITVTVRNDYPAEESIHVDYRTSSDEYFSYVGLTATLYAEDGSEISAINTDDRRGMEGYLFPLGVNETKTIEIPFSTENRNIAYYNVWSHYVYAFPR